MNLYTLFGQSDHDAVREYITQVISQIPLETLVCTLSDSLGWEFSETEAASTIASASVDLEYARFQSHDVRDALARLVIQYYDLSEAGVGPLPAFVSALFLAVSAQRPFDEWPYVEGYALVVLMECCAKSRSLGQIDPRPIMLCLSANALNRPVDAIWREPYADILWRICIAFVFQTILADALRDASDFGDQLSVGLQGSDSRMSDSQRLCLSRAANLLNYIHNSKIVNLDVEIKTIVT